MEINAEVRNAAIKKGVRLWEIAAALGHNDTWISKKLRFELPEEQKAEMLKVIDDIAENR